MTNRSNHEQGSLRAGADGSGLPPQSGRPMSSNPTRPELLAVEIAQAILEGRYQPGQKLREIPLADHYRTSRSSVREAMRILERDGVVHIAPRQGASVTRLTTDELLEIYQVRAVLLGLTMSMAASRRGSVDVQWLRRKLETIEAGAQKDGKVAAGRHATVSAEMAKHIVEASGNRLLAGLLSRMSLQIARYTLLGLSSATRRAESIATWKQVLAAMAAGDAQKADQAGRKLVQDNLRFTLQQLAQLG